MKCLSKLILLAMALVLIGRAAEAQGYPQASDDLPVCIRGEWYGDERTRCPEGFQHSYTPREAGVIQ